MPHDTPTLQTRIDPRDARFIANREANLALIADLRERLERVGRAGGEEYVNDITNGGKLHGCGSDFCANA